MYTYTAFFEHSFPSKSWQRLDDHRRSFLPGCPPEPQEPAMLAPRRRGGVITISHDGSMVLLYMVTWIPSIYPSHVSIYTSTMDPSWVWIHDGYVYDILWYGVYSYYSYYINTYINWLYIYMSNLNYKIVFLGLWKHWGCWGSCANSCFFSWDQHKIVSFCVQIYFIVVHLGFFPHVILDVSYIPSIIYYIIIIYIYIYIIISP